MLDSMGSLDMMTPRGTDDSASALVSVIVPVYNEARFLDICVSSITHQSYHNLQVLLIDDGSKDDSGALCDAWAALDDRITVIHQANQGVSTARNAGLDAARGDWIMFVDADDWLEDHAVEILMRQVGRSSSQIVISNYRSVGFADTKATVRNRPVDFPMNSGEINATEAMELMLAYDGVKGYVWNKFFSAELITSNHLRFDPNIGMCEDLLFDVSAVMKAHTIVAINDCLYNYRVHMGSAIHMMNSHVAVTCMIAHERMLKLVNAESRPAVKASYATMAEEFLMRTYWPDGDATYRTQYLRVLRRYWLQAIRRRVPPKNRVRFLGGILCPSLFYPLWNKLKGR